MARYLLQIGYNTGFAKTHLDALRGLVGEISGQVVRADLVSGTSNLVVAVQVPDSVAVAELKRTAARSGTMTTFSASLLVTVASQTAAKKERELVAAGV